MEEALTRRASRVEAVSTVLLAAAAIATAWAGYQSTRWSGDQAQEYSQASALRVESTRASSLAQSQTVIDVSTFTQWVNAYASGNANLADVFVSGRVARDRLHEAAADAAQRTRHADPKRARHR